jgi:hypothetical protein
MEGADGAIIPVVRLLHRDRDPSTLREVDCYAHVYAEGFPGHVDPIPSKPSIRAIEIEWEVETPRHATTEGLKHAFEERLAARKRQRRS